jgi:hypothetical protein
VVNRLNYLLRRELVVVADYQRMLRNLKDEALADRERILRLAANHQRTVTALEASVRDRGGSPAGASDWPEGSGAGAPTVAGTPVMLDDKEFVGALLRRERNGLAEYQAALPGLDGDAQELVELELIPRQRKHIAGLSDLLDHLATHPEPREALTRPRPRPL